MEKMSDIFKKCSSLYDITLPEIKCTSKVIDMNNCSIEEFLYVRHKDIPVNSTGYVILDIVDLEYFIKNEYQEIYDKIQQCTSLTTIPEGFFDQMSDKNLDKSE